MASVKFVVEPSWLKRSIEHVNVRVIDATWILPGSEEPLHKGYIENACYFGIRLSDRVSNVKHPLPSREEFETLNSSFGISHNHHIVCYDRKGVYSSPRLWWTFKMMGHDNVSVLNGGLPGWIEAGYNTVSEPLTAKTVSPDSYKNPDPSPKASLVTMDEILHLLPSRPQIIDARSTDRFYGRVPEPRHGLRSGHIPGSTSFPFGQFVKNGRFIPLSEMAENVGNAGINLSRPIITTCGSGVTASILALGFKRLGVDDVKVYDGSWSEWGASKAPIEV